MDFCFLHLRVADGGWPDLVQHLEDETVPAWDQAGCCVWGIWQGLFGVASNELFVMLCADAETGVVEPLGKGVKVVEQHSLVATVRPKSPTPCERDGLYVFRRFSIDTANIDTVARLSSQAWTTFEGSEEYHAEPFGLFAPATRDSETCEMLLVTWYDDFGSWQTSRTPAPEAVENFRQRRALTHATVAVATRLVRRGS
ncbi:MAG: hypothetical protein QF921_07360 [Pseudomonadales bacterium]|jgi:hypothetical protein|nr:hypothetical protein [Pseudomonadales bacterium]MDP6469848.1 hypothetical protein [Pseudomonadales bacterium]MDP6827550.1 hypothetical protein [Pseudomonadales bacterium]MDP6971318.1 hypothetical protein [Pseudomonadales bacterium]|tara:strand:+ start:2418 stop:3014 length:597 start_codon:yes stop_codon:yes gene_type:complete